MRCPDVSQLQSLIDGDLGAVEREAIHAHADECEECRKLLAALAPLASPVVTPIGEQATAAPDPDGSASRAALIASGTRIGRYEVEVLLGVGGLGTVYAARDPELGRRVAVKLLKSRADGGVGVQSRLVREAQAMARVTHPNVLSVYDVGEWRDRVFVAMELNDGGDLRAWLAEAPRRVGEIVDTFRAAGQGLAAAHEVGLVHRDFKPDNVLISKDGRVRVADFGLARAVDRSAVDAREPTEERDLALMATTPDPARPRAARIAAPEPDSLLDSPLTHAGTIMGTPAYMAPEQHRGEHVDPRTDQFAFCVALYEALQGERPFAGDDYASLREAVVRGRVRPLPRGSHVPSSLRRIVLRGLSARPGDRWPTMADLLAALGRDRTKIARRIVIVSVALLAVVATALFGDWIVRDRLYAVARTSFAAKRDQVQHTLALQYESFSALAELSTVVPMMRQVAAARDQSDFGLGEASDDTAQLAALHATLRDADWGAWSSATRRGQVAISDYKGRLLYSTGNPDGVGDDARRIAAVSAAYRPGSLGAGAQVVRGDDPNVIASGILAGPRAGLLIVFAHASVMAGVPQAMFIQTIEGRRLLEDLTSDSELDLALVAEDGSADGDVSRPLVEAAGRARGAMSEIEHDGRRWLVQSHPVPSLRPGGPPVASLVMARSADVGLAGLFPHARLVLLAAGALAVLAILASLWILRAARR
jgi:serine/threonine protein kinase